MRLDSPYLVDDYYKEISKIYDNVILVDVPFEENKTYDSIVINEGSYTYVVDCRNIIDGIVTIHCLEMRETTIGPYKAYKESKTINLDVSSITRFIKETKKGDR